MRPVTKIGWPQEGGNPKSYNPHTKAKTDLEGHLGCYCSYCEVFSSDLEVEHVISRDQDNTLSHDWNNFLVACGRCNRRDNKSNRNVDLAIMHFPHRNNTFLSFKYEEGGYVKVNPDLDGTASFTHAENMLHLVGLDKIPGNPKYPNLNQNDTRWKHRRVAWEWAVKYLPKFESGELSPVEVAEFASQKGFFSVWYSVFSAHEDVRQALINIFIGTAINCFDPANGYEPIHRNPLNIADPI